MIIDKFLEQLKKCKYSTKETGTIKAKLITDDSGTLHKLYKEKSCNGCGIKSGKYVYVSFHNPTRLTIFQAGMLYSIFVLGKRPTDYAKYHECSAGIEFIENIKDITVGTTEQHESEDTIIYKEYDKTLTEILADCKNMDSRQDALQEAFDRGIDFYDKKCKEIIKNCLEPIRPSNIFVRDLLTELGGIRK